MRTDRQEDLDRYYNDHLKLRIISRLMEIKSWSKIMGIQSYVVDAVLTQEREDHAEKKEFKEWKKKKLLKKAK